MVSILEAVCSGVFPVCLNAFPFFVAFKAVRLTVSIYFSYEKLSFFVLSFCFHNELLSVFVQQQTYLNLAIHFLNKQRIGILWKTLKWAEWVSR